MTESPFASLLRENGLRATPGRIALLALLTGEDTPMSSQEIASRREMRGLDQVTVYRTLEAFAEKNLVRRINLGHSHADYELVRERHHHHLVCTQCDAIEDFEGCGVDLLAAKALRQSERFASVTEHSVELFGLCKQCAGAKKKVA